MSLSFDRPFFILLAFIALPLFLLASRFFKPLFSLELPPGPPGGIAFKPPVNLNFLIHFLRALELLGAFLLFTAAAGPHFVFADIIWLNRGADIIFVLDVSPSMAGLDMNGRSRFDAARTLLRDFADRRQQDAVGLLAVGEDAALVIPITTDRTSLYSRLDTLSVGEMGDGTALGTGLAMAAFYISSSQAPRRVAVLITDGENNAGAVHPETAAAMLGEMGVSLWVIGVGSSGEIQISYVDPVSQMRRTGSFESRYDPEALKRIADAAKGHWIYAPSAEAFASAFSQLDHGEAIVRRSGTVRREEPLYAFFLLASLALLWGVRFVRRRILGALI